MNLIVCVDDHLGMAFNRRRQSRDRVLSQHLASLAGPGKLWVSPGSLPLFADLQVNADPDFLINAKEEDWCFAEFPPLMPYENKIRQLIVCRWNRSYPADQFLDLNLKAYRKVSSQEFPGSSHETITLEVYEK